MSHPTLDGENFKGLFIAGSHQLASNREYLNSINVFPVPDGDTGSNMADTLNNAVDALHDVEDHSLPNILETISNELRMEAKGNSGIILSEFFHGMFTALKEEQMVNPDHFVMAMSDGSDAAWAAIAEPKEGTILTVIKKTVSKLKETETELENMRIALEKLVESGRVALDETKGEMALLAENDVVDSGAHGFLLFWEGALLFLKGEVAETVLKPIRKVFKSHKSQKVKFRFCTEGLVRCEKFSRDELTEKLSPLGDSLIVTGDSGLLKIHIHTNEPDSVFEVLQGYGELIKTKADDMQEQSREKAKKDRFQKVRIITDSTSDLDLETRETLDVEMVPLQLILGDKTYRDRVEISPIEFYKKLRESDLMPRTSLPKPSDTLVALEHIGADCDHILGIYLSSGLSGTWQSGKKWGDDFAGERSTAFDSLQASLGLGLMVIEAAKMAKGGAELEEIIERLETLKSRIRTYLTVDSLDFLAKGGRIGSATKVFGQILGAKPILKLSDGKVASFSKGFGRRGVVKKLVAILEKEADVPGFEGVYGMVWTDDSELRDGLIEAMKARLPIKSLTVGFASPVVGAKVGPGSLGVFCY